MASTAAARSARNVVCTTQKKSKQAAKIGAIVTTIGIIIAITKKPDDSWLARRQAGIEQELYDKTTHATFTAREGADAQKARTGPTQHRTMIGGCTTAVAWPPLGAAEKMAEPVSLYTENTTGAADCGSSGVADGPDTGSVRDADPAAPKACADAAPSQTTGAAGGAGCPIATTNKCGRFDSPCHSEPTTNNQQHSHHTPPTPSIATTTSHHHQPTTPTPTLTTRTLSNYPTSLHNSLHTTAPYCTLLHHTTLHSTTLLPTASHHILLHPTAPHCTLTHTTAP